MIPYPRLELSRFKKVKLGVKTLVIGGLGFIGSHLSCHLKESGHDVTVLDSFRNPTGKMKLGEGFRVIKGDITSTDSPLAEEVKNADVVFNLAVRSLPESLQDPVGVAWANIVGCHMVCIASSKHAKKLVHISSSEVYGTAKYIPIDESHPLLPSTPYAASKVSQEMFVSTYAKYQNLQTVIVRPFNAYGPFMREDRFAAMLPVFVDRARKGQPLPISGDGTQTRDLTYVEDTVRGIALAGDVFPVGEVVNIASGTEVRIIDLALAVAKHYKYEEFAFTEERPGDIKRHLASTEKAARLLGFRASMSIEEGVRRYILWYEANHPLVHK